MQRPRLSGVLETCIYVSDMARAKAFYQQVFGFEAMVSDERICALNVSPGSVLILFKQGGTLRPVPVGGSFIPPHDGNGKEHFAFAVPDNAFENWKVYLKSLDIEVESQVIWPQGGRSIYFRDPDGLLVELATPGLWTNY